jgi:CHAD domain-containing protein
MRVASRRLRSALRDFKPYLRRRKLERVTGELKRLARALGAVRDADVAIKALEELQEKAPAEAAAGIADLLGESRAERETARARLRETLADQRLATLQKHFNETLEGATKPRAPRHRKKREAAAEPTFHQLGREITRARLEELLALRACLYQPFRPAALHRLRIAAKRLRYAMALFAPCWNDELAARAKEVGKLQSSLGKLHDCDVRIKGFSRMLRELQEREEEDASQAFNADERKRSAAVWLLSHFARERMKHFESGAARWLKWEKSGFLTELAGSLDARPPANYHPSSSSLLATVALDLKAKEPA